ncbi:hypothetical protein C8Q80DRAFT_1265571 [Daedaleopsis nitida]|nr:hypothetical protein C8Q80DRAFT_1265571 [Daedaleopsis nitida]
MCGKPECYTLKVEPETRDDLAFLHMPSYDVFKIRTAIHQIQEFGSAHRAAQTALKGARMILAHAAISESSCLKWGSHNRVGIASNATAGTHASRAANTKPSTRWSECSNSIPPLSLQLSGIS